MHRFETDGELQSIMRPRNAVWRARFGLDFLTASTFHPAAAVDPANGSK